MSDEESFVILGSSPSPSMDTVNSLPMASNFPSTTVLKEAMTATSGPKSGPVANGITQSQLTTSSSSDGSQYSIVQNGNKKATAVTNGTTTSEVDGDVGSLIADCMAARPSLIASKHSSNGSENGNSMPIKFKTNAMESSNITNDSAKLPNRDSSLAASFILGEVSSDVLKASVYSQFPSICSMGACPEDVNRIQTMLSEYMELKKTLLNTNITMKQLYDQTQKWKADVKAMEDERRAEIAKLRNENLELRQDLDIKVEQIKLNDEVRRKEHDEFIKTLSEKTSQIENMSAQILKLEQQQLASFEFIPKNDTERMATAAGSTNITVGNAAATAAAEYVTIAEHKRIVKNFERQLSEIVAENLELKDLQQQYIDEINCLKVNLVAAEELHIKNQDDIKFLKASDEEKSEMFSKFDEERKTLRVDLDVLRQQLDIYCRDFKIEQESRENLANEKDQLLSDLRELQKKNQELIQEAQKNYEEHTRQAMTGTGAVPKTRTTQTVTSLSSSPSPSPKPSLYSPENNFNCPICGQIFKTLCILQTHVNQCLDGH